MLTITEEQRKMLEPLIPNLNELVEKNDLLTLIDEIDNLILDEFYDHFEKLTMKGTKLQIMLDQIYYANEQYNYVNSMRRAESEQHNT